jgi:hypothetical protein
MVVALAGTLGGCESRALEQGVEGLQPKRPIAQMSMFLSGFHMSKSEPSLALESNHYCHQLTKDFMQCVLFDGSGKNARMHGVEYIISDQLYAKLPESERLYWHPHNYEILSGQLTMPSVPAALEKLMLARKIDSYGKIWLFWNAGAYHETADPLPYGPPQLGWSFNHDGEAPAGLVESRDRRLNVDTAQKREERAELSIHAEPQAGVDALAYAFPNADGAPAGVKDNGDPSARPVPVCVVNRPAAD